MRQLDGEMQELQDNYYMKKASSNLQGYYQYADRYTAICLHVHPKFSK